MLVLLLVLVPDVRDDVLELLVLVPLVRDEVLVLLALVVVPDVRVVPL